MVAGLPGEDLVILASLSLTRECQQLLDYYHRLAAGERQRE